MTPSDHNKTLAIIYRVMGWYFTVPLLLAPLILYKTLAPRDSPRRSTQLLGVALACVLLLALVLLFHAAAYGLRRRRRRARRLALWLIPALLFTLPPAIVYVWWFFHSEGGRQMYGEEDYIEPVRPPIEL
jgi:hypothetical protein